MFKSILPSRRVPSTDFQMVTPPLDSAMNGKENWPDPSMPIDTKQTRVEKSKKRKGKEQAPGPDTYMATHAFEKLLVSVHLLCIWHLAIVLLGHRVVCTTRHFACVPYSPLLCCDVGVLLHCSVIARRAHLALPSAAPTPSCRQATVACLHSDFFNRCALFSTLTDTHGRTNCKCPTTCGRN